MSKAVDTRIDFLYLSEEDMIKAGVLNMKECVNTMEEVYRLLSKGDYVMSGRNQNSHGAVLMFPDNPEHEGMPKNGPDRRFCAMPAYLGGEFQIGGCKWYGSNLDNLKDEQPRSILMLTLNDKDSGAPKAFMAANLLSAWRTGAIPGVGVRHLAKPGAKVIGLLGAGSIGTSSAESIVLETKDLELVKIYDIVEANAKALKGRLQEEYNIDVQLVNSEEECVRGSDIINLATSGIANPKIEEDWLEPGALITCSSSGSFDPDFAINRAKLVVDNWKMYEAVVEEDVYPYNNLYMGVVGRLFLDWIHEGKMTSEIITDIGDIINGKKPARDHEDQVVILALGGMPVYDVAWAKKIYDNAIEKGIGTKLNLWDRAYQARDYK